MGFNYWLFRIAKKLEMELHGWPICVELHYLVLKMMLPHGQGWSKSSLFFPYGIHSSLKDCSEKMLLNLALLMKWCCFLRVQKATLLHFLFFVDQVQLELSWAIPKSRVRWVKSLRPEWNFRFSLTRASHSKKSERTRERTAPVTGIRAADDGR